MRIAFFIAADRLPRQFEWLFNAIWNARDVFVVHVDSASPDSYVREIGRIAASHPNVFFLPRTRVTWGGWSMVEMNLLAIQFLCQRPETWSHFVNLSGQDYPLRPVEDFRKFLHNHQHVNFIQSKHIDTQPFHIRRRLHWYCFERHGHLQRLPIPNVRGLLAPVEWCGGMWCILSREFCQWLAASELVDVFRSALRNTKIPDEFFFQSVIKNSPFANTLDTDCRRYIRFDLHAANPRVVTSSELPHLITSTDFFARKFDEQVDISVLRRLADRVGAPHADLDEVPIPSSPLRSIDTASGLDGDR